MKKHTREEENRKLYSLSIEDLQSVMGEVEAELKFHLLPEEKARIARILESPNVQKEIAELVKEYLGTQTFILAQQLSFQRARLL
jgi:hypothetical protein